ncbi:TadE/TadG family type IV pilus assembly protein [Agrococcus casei]|uniref:Putative membrane protein n=1 Tax=Agrococcus casei LMG 22410 TaxID=1255656 RepID=A0A1R4FIW7_9MICO|nr:TadE/TadG family type IV pilus assembly protein [Agrococcus casei]SJM55895.1 putative membrane protein [Agrococcus casei LMG 22410]
MLRTLTRLRRDDNGSATVEIVILAPVFLMVLLLIVGLGRIQMAGNSTESAAGNGARAATLQGDQASADNAAEQAVRDSLTSNGINCQQLTINLDTSAVENQLGQVGTVTVDITCVVSLSDISVPGLPGNYTLNATGTSPINPYSER